MSSPVSNSNSSFLLLNTEFHNHTSLFGFVLYAAVAGSISIQVNNRIGFILVGISSVKKALIVPIVIYFEN